MKKYSILTILSAGLIYVTFSSSSIGGAVGAGADGTQATGGAGCSCHTHNTTTTVALELDSAGIPVTHYVPGIAYTIKVTGTNTSTSNLPYCGFQVTVVKSAGAGTASAALAGALGTTGLPSGARYTSAAAGCGIDVLEHNTRISPTTGTGGSGTTYVISNLPWTAPAAGTGTVKVYGCINAVNGSGSGGDRWNNNSISITELGGSSGTVGTITGTETVCVGSTTTLSCTPSGGTWSSSATAVATVSAAGTVSGVTAGVATISYNAGSAGVATVVVTVNAVGAAAITGSNTVCIGSTITLTDATSGGTWTSSAVTKATVGSASGIVTGVAAGTTVISYTATNSCGTSTATHSVNVLPASTCHAAIAATEIKSGLEIYPNPSMGSFRINLVTENDEPGQYTIFRISGEKVGEGSLLTNTVKEVQIPRVPGLYVVTLTTAGSVYTQRILVQ